MLPALSMLPGSTARVISVPSDGATNVVSCRSSSAWANCACACSRLAFAWAMSCARLPVRYWLNLSWADFSVACAWSRDERAFSRSLAEIVRLFHKPC